MKFKYIRFLAENYQARLSQRGVGQDILDYIETLRGQEKGKAIAKIMSNPKLELDDLKYEEFRLEDDTKHFDVMDADPTIVDNVNRIDTHTPTGDYYRIIAKWLNG